jgi:hypothetical protein
MTRISAGHLTQSGVALPGASEPFSMINQELEFWRKQAKNAALIMAIRADQNRAIGFFGADAVLSEHEVELYAIMEAYEIINADENELLGEMNRPLDSAAVGWHASPVPELREYGEKRPRFTLGDIAKLKQHAQDHLNGIFPKD